MDQITNHQSPPLSDYLRPQSPALATLLDSIAEGAALRDRERQHPYDIVELIRRSRLGALRVRAADGGSNATSRDLFALIIRLAEADSNVAHVFRNHFSFVERFVRNHPSQKHAKWRKAVLDGAMFGVAYGELDLAQVGSKESNTTIIPEGDGFRVNGTKFYSTGSLYADYILIRGKLADGVLASAIVPVTREGVELVDDWDGFGQRVTGSGTTILRDVLVSADEVVLDTEGSFFAQPYAGPVPQLILTAINAGILRAIMRDASALLRGRGRSYAHASHERPAADPILQLTVGQIASSAFAAEATVLAAADSLDLLEQASEIDTAAFEAASHEAALQTSKAKVVVDEFVLRAAGQLLDVGGASATRQIHGLDRHWRNARTLASHNPTPYKARSIGDHVINGTPLPTTGFF